MFRDTLAKIRAEARKREKEKKKEEEKSPKLPKQNIPEPTNEKTEIALKTKVVGEPTLTQSKIVEKTEERTITEVISGTAKTKNSEKQNLTTNFTTQEVEIKETEPIEKLQIENQINKKEEIYMSLEKEGTPLIKFESNASAPILRYDIPSPSSYEGRNYIELKGLKLDGKTLPFNQKARKSTSAKEFLELNRKNIFEYLANATKIDLERDLYLVFDLDEIESEEVLVQYPGTFSFADDSLSGWSIGGGDNTIAQIMEKKLNHTKVLFFQGGPNAGMYNDFEERSSGTIEFWVMFSNTDASNWWNQIQFHYKNTNIGTFYVTGGNLRWYTQSTSGEKKTYPIQGSILNKWIHIKVSWDGNRVYLFVDNVPKLTTKWFLAHNKIDRFWIGSWAHREVWVDAIGYSWDPNYKVGDNLIEQDIVVSRKDVQSEILESIDKIEPGVSNILNSIRGEDETQLKEKYQLFKYFLQVAIDIYKRMPIFYRTMSGQLKLKWVNYPVIRPRLMFVETYRLTSFPGDYGAGTTIKTFSLLPKEETEISIKTWKKSIKTTNEASSILDSYTEEKADEFENSVQTENSSTSRVEESNSYHAEVGGGVSWGAVSVNASAGTEGGSSSAREEFAKNVMNATAKHSQSASAKREVNIETSFESTEETGEEITIMRRIENLNASRTLNFTFRQMNQQFHSLLHLIDVRIAFYNGFPGSMKEFALYELDNLVEEYLTPEYIPQEEEGETGAADDEAVGTDPVDILEPEIVEAKLRDFILEEYSHVMDYQSNIHKILEEITLNRPNGNTYKYLRVIPPTEREEVIDGKKEIVKVGQQKYKMREELKDDDVKIIQVEDVRYLEGIITGRKVLTMKTDGIIVEALLGQANALDNYALESRREKIIDEQLNNSLKNSEVVKINSGIELINKLVENNQFDKAVEAYKDFFGIQEGLRYFKDLFEQAHLEIETRS